MSKVSLEQALALLQEADSFLLTSHVSPDGDALGSMLSLRQLLLALGKKRIDCALHDAVPRQYRDLPGASTVQNATQITGPWDLVVVTDVAQMERIGDVAALASSDDQHVLVLDHHLEQNPCGTHNFVDSSYASASEIIVDLYEIADVKMSIEAAECAYVGMATDTGGFRFSNTRPETHERAARLLHTGLDVAELSNRLFETMTGSKFQLLRHVLRNTEVDETGLFALSTIRLSEMSEAKATREDLDGLVNYARNIEGVHVGVLLREEESGAVKVSMRSGEGFNSAALLSEFGGGGHAAAAGATVLGALEDVQKSIVEAVRAVLNGHDRDKREG